MYGRSTPLVQTSDAAATSLGHDYYLKKNCPLKLKAPLIVQALTLERPGLRKAWTTGISSRAGVGDDFFLIGIKKKQLAGQLVSYKWVQCNYHLFGWN